MTAKEIDALEVLKRTNQGITSSLQNDLELLQGKQKFLEIDLQQHQNHLIQALLAKDRLEKELGATKDGEPAADMSQSGLDALKEVSRKTDSVTLAISYSKKRRAFKSLLNWKIQLFSRPTTI